MAALEDLWAVHFTKGHITLAYRTIGRGPGPIIAFHGFGRTGEDFRVFEHAWGSHFTIHAFDLPFHGESPSPSERAIMPFEQEELRDYFTAFLDRIGAERITLIGYSLGGRIALSLLATMPERIMRAVLLAPDGLHTRPWYRVFARLHWGRKRYAHFIERPERMHGVADLLHRLHLINDRMHRFVIGQTDTRAKRQLLHDVWLSFRHIEPDLDQVAANLQRNGIMVTLVFGAKDSVIEPELARRFQPKAPERITTRIVDAGHQLLTGEIAERLRSDLGL